MNKLKSKEGGIALCDAGTGIHLCDLTPQHIEDFYQTILDDGYTTNTVIHYHAIIRKALQSAVKKDILDKNPADKVDRPKKNVYHGTFYSEDEMRTLFDAIAGDPLELCVKIAAYYGLRRSEVLAWSGVCGAGENSFVPQEPPPPG